MPIRVARVFPSLTRSLRSMVDSPSLGPSGRCAWCTGIPLPSHCAGCSWAEGPQTTLRWPPELASGKGLGALLAPGCSARPSSRALWLFRRYVFCLRPSGTSRWSSRALRGPPEGVLGTLGGPLLRLRLSAFVRPSGPSRRYTRHPQGHLCRASGPWPSEGLLAVFAESLGPVGHPYDNNQRRKNASLAHH